MVQFFKTSYGQEFGCQKENCQRKIVLAVPAIMVEYKEQATFIFNNYSQLKRSLHGNRSRRRMRLMKLKDDLRKLGLSKRARRKGLMQLVVRPYVVLKRLPASYHKEKLLQSLHNSNQNFVTSHKKSQNGHRDAEKRRIEDSQDLPQQSNTQILSFAAETAPISILDASKICRNEVQGCNLLGKELSNPRERIINPIQDFTQKATKKDFHIDVTSIKHRDVSERSDIKAACSSSSSKNELLKKQNFTHKFANKNSYSESKINFSKDKSISVSAKKINIFVDEKYPSSGNKSSDTTERLRLTKHRSDPKRSINSSEDANVFARQHKEKVSSLKTKLDTLQECSNESKIVNNFSECNVSSSNITIPEAKANDFTNENKNTQLDLELVKHINTSLQYKGIREDVSQTKINLESKNLSTVSLHIEKNSKAVNKRKVSSKSLDQNALSIKIRKENKINTSSDKVVPHNNIGTSDYKLDRTKQRIWGNITRNMMKNSENYKSLKRKRERRKNKYKKKREKLKKYFRVSFDPDTSESEEDRKILLNYMKRKKQQSDHLLHNDTTKEEENYILTRKKIKYFYEEGDTKLTHDTNLQKNIESINSDNSYDFTSIEKCATHDATTDTEIEDKASIGKRITLANNMQENMESNNSDNSCDSTACTEKYYAMYNAADEVGEVSTRKNEISVNSSQENTKDISSDNSCDSSASTEKDCAIKDAATKIKAKDGALICTYDTSSNSQENTDIVIFLDKAKTDGSCDSTVTEKYFMHDATTDEKIEDRPGKHGTFANNSQKNIEDAVSVKEKCNNSCNSTVNTEENYATPDTTTEKKIVEPSIAGASTCIRDMTANNSQKSIENAESIKEKFDNSCDSTANIEKHYSMHDATDEKVENRVSKYISSTSANDSQESKRNTILVKEQRVENSLSIVATENNSESDTRAEQSKDINPSTIEMGLDENTSGMKDRNIEKQADITCMPILQNQQEKRDICNNESVDLTQDTQRRATSNLELPIVLAHDSELCNVNEKDSCDISQNVKNLLLTSNDVLKVGKTSLLDQSSVTSEKNSLERRRDESSLVQTTNSSTSSSQSNCSDSHSSDDDNSSDIEVEIKIKPKLKSRISRKFSLKAPWSEVNSCIQNLSTFKDNPNFLNEFFEINHKSFERSKHMITSKSPENNMSLNDNQNVTAETEEIIHDSVSTVKDNAKCSQQQNFQDSPILKEDENAMDSSQRERDKCMQPVKATTQITTENNSVSSELACDISDLKKQIHDASIGDKRKIDEEQHSQDKTIIKKVRSEPVYNQQKEDENTSFIEREKIQTADNPKQIKVAYNVPDLGEQLPQTFSVTHSKVRPITEINCQCAMKFSNLNASSTRKCVCSKICQSTHSKSVFPQLTSQSVSHPSESLQLTSQSAPCLSVSSQSPSTQSAPHLSVISQLAPIQSAPRLSVSSQLVPTQSAPRVSVPSQLAPRLSVSSQLAPTQSAPRASVPSQLTPTQSASRLSLSSQLAPTQLAPRASIPSQLASTQSAPRLSVSSQLAPTQSAPRASVPSQLTPTQSAPRLSLSSQLAPTQLTPRASIPSQLASTQSAPRLSVSSQLAPTQSVFSQLAPIQSSQLAPTQSAPRASVPSQLAPTQLAPRLSVSSQLAPTQSVPYLSISFQLAPIQSAPRASVHSQLAPTQSAPRASVLSQLASHLSVSSQLARTQSASRASVLSQLASRLSVSSQLAPTQSAPRASVPSQLAPTQSAPRASVPSQLAPIQSAPRASVLSQLASRLSVSSQLAPTQSAPRASVPSQLAPTQSAPRLSVSSQLAPTQSVFSQLAPIQSAHTQSTPHSSISPQLTSQSVSRQSVHPQLASQTASDPSVSPQLVSQSAFRPSVSLQSTHPQLTSHQSVPRPSLQSTHSEFIFKSVPKLPSYDTAINQIYFLSRTNAVAPVEINTPNVNNKRTNYNDIIQITMKSVYDHIRYCRNLIYYRVVTRRIPKELIDRMSIYVQQIYVDLTKLKRLLCTEDTQNYEDVIIYINQYMPLNPPLTLIEIRNYFNLVQTFVMLISRQNANASQYPNVSESVSSASMSNANTQSSFRNAPFPDTGMPNYGNSKQSSTMPHSVPTISNINQLQLFCNSTNYSQMPQSRQPMPNMRQQFNSCVSSTAHSCKSNVNQQQSLENPIQGKYMRSANMSNVGIQEAFVNTNNVSSSNINMHSYEPINQENVNVPPITNMRQSHVAKNTISSTATASAANAQQQKQIYSQSQINSRTTICSPLIANQNVLLGTSQMTVHNVRLSGALTVNPDGPEINTTMRNVKHQSANVNQHQVNCISQVSQAPLERTKLLPQYNYPNPNKAHFFTLQPITIHKMQNHSTQIKTPHQNTQQIPQQKLSVNQASANVPPANNTRRSNVTLKNVISSTETVINQHLQPKDSCAIDLSIRNISQNVQQNVNKEIPESQNKDYGRKKAPSKKLQKENSSAHNILQNTSGTAPKTSTSQSLNVFPNTIMSSQHYNNTSGKRLILSKNAQTNEVVYNFNLMKLTDIQKIMLHHQIRSYFHMSDEITNSLNKQEYERIHHEKTVLFYFYQHLHNYIKSMMKKSQAEKHVDKDSQDNTSECRAVLQENTIQTSVDKLTKTQSNQVNENSPVCNKNLEEQSSKQNTDSYILKNLKSTAVKNNLPGNKESLFTSEFATGKPLSKYIRSQESNGRLLKELLQKSSLIEKQPKITENVYETSNVTTSNSNIENDAPSQVSSDTKDHISNTKDQNNEVHSDGNEMFNKNLKDKMRNDENIAVFNSTEIQSEPLNISPSIKQVSLNNMSESISSIKKCKSTKITQRVTHAETISKFHLSQQEVPTNEWSDDSDATSESSFKLYIDESPKNLHEQCKISFSQEDNLNTSQDSASLINTTKCESTKIVQGDSVHEKHVESIEFCLSAQQKDPTNNWSNNSIDESSESSWELCLDESPKKSQNDEQCNEISSSKKDNLSTQDSALFDTICESTKITQVTEKHAKTISEFCSNAQQEDFSNEQSNNSIDETFERKLYTDDSAKNTKVVSSFSKNISEANSSDIHQEFVTETQNTENTEEENSEQSLLKIEEMCLQEMSLIKVEVSKNESSMREHAIKLIYLSEDNNDIRELLEDTEEEKIIIDSHNDINLINKHLEEGKMIKDIHNDINTINEQLRHISKQTCQTSSCNFVQEDDSVDANEKKEVFAENDVFNANIVDYTSVKNDTNMINEQLRHVSKQTYQTSSCNFVQEDDTIDANEKKEVFAENDVFNANIVDYTSVENDTNTINEQLRHVSKQTYQTSSCNFVQEDDPVDANEKKEVSAENDVLNAKTVDYTSVENDNDSKVTEIVPNIEDIRSISPSLFEKLDTNIFSENNLDILDKNDEKSMNIIDDLEISDVDGSPYLRCKRKSTVCNFVQEDDPVDANEKKEVSAENYVLNAKIVDYTSVENDNDFKVTEIVPNIENIRSILPSLFEKLDTNTFSENNLDILDKNDEKSMDIIDDLEISDDSLRCLRCKRKSIVCCPCLEAVYCSKRCQSLHWKTHHKQCKGDYVPCIDLV